MDWNSHKDLILGLNDNGLSSTEIVSVLKEKGLKLSKNADRLVRKKLNKWGCKAVKLSPEIAKKLGFIPRGNNLYTLSPEKYAVYGNIPVGEGIKRLFFDIETSPLITYTWRIGYNINLSYDQIIEQQKVICISWKWEGDDKVYNDRWDSSTKDDKGLLERFMKVASEADEIIAHNGDRYDIKKLRTRCVYHRIPAFPSYRTLDTLKKSRSSFSFPSNKLDDIGQFLGVGQKVKHEGFSMWVKCMEGDEEALNQMIEYCDGDIILLEDVFLVIKNYIINNTHSGVINGNLKHSCPSCGSEEVELHKNVVTAKGTVQRQMECGGCGYNYNISNSAYRLMLEMRMNEKMSE